MVMLSAFYCFAVKDNTREPILLESDRVAIKYSLNEVNNDSDIEVEIAKRVTLGHNIEMFRQMLKSELDTGEDNEMRNRKR